MSRSSSAGSSDFPSSVAAAAAPPLRGRGRRRPDSASIASVQQRAPSSSGDADPPSPTRDNRPSDAHAISGSTSPMARHRDDDLARIASRRESRSRVSHSRGRPSPSSSLGRMDDDDDDDDDDDGAYRRKATRTARRRYAYGAERSFPSTSSFFEGGDTVVAVVSWRQ